MYISSKCINVTNEIDGRARQANEADPEWSLSCADIEQVVSNDHNKFSFLSQILWNVLQHIYEFCVWTSYIFRPEPLNQKHFVVQINWRRIDSLKALLGFVNFILVIKKTKRSDSL